jgi:hypothetical protein
MKKSVVRGAAALAVLGTICLSALGALAQGSDQKTGDAKPKDASRSEDVRKRIDEISEVGRQLNGPAANPECYWLGQRVINLLIRDDLDTAFRHLDLYDRFGCPGGHIQATFRCLVRQGADVIVDPKTPGQVNERIQACWISPTATQPPAQAPAATAEQPQGTTSR